MPDPSNLYPAPPAPGSAIPSLLQNPLAAVGLAAQTQNMNIQRQQFQSQQASGNAMLGAINPDGSYSPNIAFQNLKGDPNASYAAPETISRLLGNQGQLLSNQGQVITNQTGTYNLAANQTSQLGTWLSGLSAVPNPKYEDVLNSAVQFARSSGIPSDRIMAMVRPLNGLSGAALTDRLNLLASSMAGLSGAGVTGGGVEVTNQAGGKGTIAPGAAPFVRSANAPNRGAPGSLPTALNPQQLADISEYQTDQTKTAQTLANLRPLEQALPLVRNLSNFDYGKGSEDIAKVKDLLTTFGITNVDPNNELVVRQEVNKKLLQYANNAVNAGRSDAALSAAIHSNPNIDLTQPANIALILSQIGSDRMDAALPLAAGGAPGYKDYKSNYYQKYDPRAFAFHVMTLEEQKDLQKSLGPKNSPAYQKFLQSYNIAKTTGMLTPPSQPSSGQ